MPKIAVVIEDEEDIRALICEVLENSGYDVRAADNGLSGVELVREGAPEITTLDVNMPGIDGYETARRIREFSDTHIIMITAFVEESDADRGLRAGADEYLGKPFRPRDLRARIEAIRDRPPKVPTTGGWSDSVPADERGAIALGRLRIDTVACEASVDGASLELSSEELDLLITLSESANRAVGKVDLALALRGDRHRGQHLAAAEDVRAVERHIASLRTQLEASGAVRIEIVRGEAYRLTTA